jgi:hypothetical protein
MFCVLDLVDLFFYIDAGVSLAPATTVADDEEYCHTWFNRLYWQE